MKSIFSHNKDKPRQRQSLGGDRLASYQTSHGVDIFDFVFRLALVRMASVLPLVKLTSELTLAVVV